MEIEKSKGDRISTLLKEAIALHNEVNLRLGGGSNGGYDYQAFIDAVCNFAGSENLVLGSLSRIFNDDNEDLFLKFHSFLSDSSHQATSFSETLPSEDKEDAMDLESQTIKFLKKLRSGIGDNGVNMFVFEFQRGLDMKKIKRVAENYMRRFPDLMKEFDDIIERYMEVDQDFLGTHEGMHNFDRLMKYAFDEYQRIKTRNPCPCQISTDQIEKVMRY